MFFNYLFHSLVINDGTGIVLKGIRFYIPLGRTRVKLLAILINEQRTNELGIKSIQDPPPQVFISGKTRSTYKTIIKGTKMY